MICKASWFTTNFSSLLLDSSAPDCLPAARAGVGVHGSGALAAAAQCAIDVVVEAKVTQRARHAVHIWCGVSVANDAHCRAADSHHHSSSSLLDLPAPTTAHQQVMCSSTQSSKCQSSWHCIDHFLRSLCVQTSSCIPTGPNQSITLLRSCNLQLQDDAAVLPVEGVVDPIGHCWHSELMAVGEPPGPQNPRGHSMGMMFASVTATFASCVASICQGDTRSL